MSGVIEWSRSRLFLVGVVSALLLSVTVLGECDGAEETLGGWQEFFPKGSSVSPVAGLKDGEEAYEVRAKDGSLLGWVFRTDRVGPEVKGAVDQLGVLVAVSKDRKIVGIKLVEFKDMPANVEMIKDVFYGQFKGRSVDDTWVMMDTVTGATVSSSAIARDVFLSARRLLSATSPGK